jgi:serine phosphatase RsbU (regulator of sigma subunit)
LQNFIFPVIVQRVIVNRKKHILLERLVSHRTAQLTNALDELKSKNDVIESQRFEAFEKTKIITESIQYAKIIQESILPLDEEIKEVLPDYFVVYRPLNIVSGDFYWVKSNNNIQYLVVADCTGHGVPGAFMSLLGITLLNDILQDTLMLSAAQILGVLRNRIKEELHQSRHKQTSRDGMDMVICVIDKQKRMIEFAGANISLIAIKTSHALESKGKRELYEFKGDKMPVGIHEIESPFTLHSIPIDVGDIYYISSDGFRDQIGGPNDNKYGSKRFRELLLSIHSESFSKQKKRLNSEFNLWKGDNDQIDDVTIVGFSFD